MHSNLVYMTHAYMHLANKIFGQIHIIKRYNQIITKIKKSIAYSYNNKKKINKPLLMLQGIVNNT